MGIYGKTLLTRPLFHTRDLEWVYKSRMQFAEHEHFSGVQCYTLSPLGIINGIPILSRYFRLASVVEEDGLISGWKVIRWS